MTRSNCSEPADENTLPQSGHRSRLLTIAAWIGFLSPPLVLHLLVPMPCPMLVATGFECPGCGGTRSVRALVAGDLPGAIDLNAAVVAAPFVVAVYFASASRLRKRTSLQWQGFHVLLAGILVWGVLRNLPGLESLLAGE